MTKKLSLISLAFFLALSSCGSKTSDRMREGDNSGQKVALTVEEEKKLTREALAQMAKEYPPAQSPELQAYIKKLGNKLVEANKLNNNPYSYTFTVVDVPNVNAFAMPAGSVFMTAPIIAMAESEAEIAGVLGHEIGHVTARHTAERMYLEKQEQPKTWLLGGVGAVLGGAAGYFLGKRLCAPNDSGCRAKMAVYGIGGGAGAGLLVQKYGFMANSREDELESDRVGFRYAVNAGYDKNKVGDFYTKLMAMEKEAKGQQGGGVMGWLADAMSTHPPSNERVKQSEELKRSLSGPGTLASSPEFESMRSIARDIVEKSKVRAKPTAQGASVR